MQKICTYCNHIGKGQHDLLSGNVYLGTLELVIGIGLLITKNEIFNSMIYGAIFSIILILLGIFNIIAYKNGGKNCPSCKKKRAMISLDKPEAQQLIKENNISVPKS